MVIISFPINSGEVEMRNGFILLLAIIMLISCCGCVGYYDRDRGDYSRDIVNANAENALIAATATTFWFGFKDDVAIRITAQHHGSRIDVRSVSRAGKSDLRTNARRIQNFLKLLKSMQSGYS